MRKSDVPVDMEYYILDPGVRFTTTLLTLGLPFADLLNTAIIKVLGAEDTLLTNNPVYLDSSSVASFDLSSGTLTAHSAGDVEMHTRAYHFDTVLDWILISFEGWIYLEDSTTITVSSQSDPVNSNVDDAPVSGVVPSVFSTDGGDFEISVSPVDPNGDLIHSGVTLSSFSFSPIQVTSPNDLLTVITTGMATPFNMTVIPPSDPTSGVSVVILLDSSGSMGTNDPGRDRVTAAKSLVGLLDQDDQAAVMDFGAGTSSGYTGARLLQDFTSDHVLLDSAIDQVTASGGTPMYAALHDAILLISSSAAPNPAIVVLTDGQASDSDFDGVVASAKASSVPVFPVGLGTSLDFTELQALGNQTGGTFASALDSDQLQVLFVNLGTAVRAGRILVTASGAFLPPLQSLGAYTVSGTLYTRVVDVTLGSPFSFQVDVLADTP